MADTIFNSARAAIMGDNAISGTPVDLEGDTIKCLLLKNTYTIDATDVYVSDLTPGTNEVANGNGYTTGGTAITCSVTYSGATATFDATDATWPASTITARYAVVYKDTGLTTTSPVLFLYDFGADKSSSGGTFTVAWHASGLATLS